MADLDPDLDLDLGLEYLQNLTDQEKFQLYVKFRRMRQEYAKSKPQSFSTWQSKRMADEDFRIEYAMRSGINSTMAKDLARAEKSLACIRESMKNSREILALDNHNDVEALVELRRFKIWSGYYIRWGESAGEVDIASLKMKIFRDQYLSGVHVVGDPDTLIRSIEASIMGQKIQVQVKVGQGFLYEELISRVTFVIPQAAIDQKTSGIDKTIRQIIAVILPGLVDVDCAKQECIDTFIVEKLESLSKECKWGLYKRTVAELLIKAVSFAVCQAASRIRAIPLYKHIAELAGNRNVLLPVPALSVFKDGSHEGIPILDFMILPMGAASFKGAMIMGNKVCRELKEVIKKEKNGQDATNNIQEKTEFVELLDTAIQSAGYTDKVVIGVNVSAEDKKTYDLNFTEENDDGSQISGKVLKDLYKSFVSKYTKVVSIEGPFDHNDRDRYAELTKEIGKTVQVVGDCSLVSNLEGLQEAIKLENCNAFLLKVTQFQSVSQIIKAVKIAKLAGWGVIACYSSGDSEDDVFVANLTVGLAMGQIKLVAPNKSGLLEAIEVELGARTPAYAGEKFRAPVEPY